MTDISMILPVHNEEDIIEPVFVDIYETFKKMKATFELILVENGSIDKSYQVIKNLERKYKYVRVARSSPGYGSAVIKGTTIAEGKYISYMPSDGQVDVKTLPRLWQLAITNKYDLVKVKRISRENLGRYLTSRTFSILMVLFFRTKYIDVNASPRILLKKKWDTLKIRSKDSFGDGEMLIKATHLRWKIKEIPMDNIDRLGGKSTRSIHTYTEFIYNMIRFRFSSELSHWKKVIE